MWPIRKTNKKKGVTISGGKIDLIFRIAWRKDKDEVVILTPEGPVVLDGRGEYFIVLKADKLDPIRVKIVPDFKKRKLEFIEVIDPKNISMNAPKLKFVGACVENIDDINPFMMVQELDKSLKTFEKILKNYRTLRNIFVPIGILLIIYNSFSFFHNATNLRYLNLFAVIIGVLTIFLIIKDYRNFLKNYEKYKEIRKYLVEVVKEK